MIIIKNRQLELILYLNEVKKTTITELAERFEVTKRTIMRDINYISSLGVPVNTQPGYQGGVSIREHYKFQQGFFSAEEVGDLILALYLIGQIRKNGEKNSIIKKLEMIVPELAYVKETDINEYLKVELFEEPLYQDKTIFQTINTALDAEKMIRVEVDEQEYCIAPLSYALRPTGLFLYATNGKQKLTFRVTDIVRCVLTEQEFCHEDYLHFCK